MAQDYRSSPLADALEAPLRQFLAQTGPDDQANLHAMVIADVERVLLRVVMEARGDNQLQAAATLGLNRNTLRKKLTALGLAMPRQRSARLGTGKRVRLRGKTP